MPSMINEVNTEMHYVSPGIDDNVKSFIDVINHLHS